MHSNWQTPRPHGAVARLDDREGLRSSRCSAGRRAVPVINSIR